MQSIAPGKIANQSQISLGMSASRKQLPPMSIVVPTHGRVDLVKELLASLKVASTNYGEQSQIIIVDSSPGYQSKLIEQACQISGAVFCHMANNVRAKRNWGVTHAEFPIVLFIDSDCRADPNLLTEHGQIYAGENAEKIGGVIGLTRFVGRENWVWKVIEQTSTLDSFSFCKHNDYVPWGPTCNISYRREVIQRVGLFDTSFPFALGGDDTDLGLRVGNAGYLIRCNSNAVVEHARETWSSLSLISSREFRWGRMHYHLMQKHADRVYYDFPTVLGLFLFLVAFLLPASFVTQRIQLAALPLCWLVSELILETFLMGRLPGNRARESGYLLTARLLGLTFQAGTLIEALRSVDFQVFYKEISYSPSSLRGRNRRIVQVWACTLALLVSVLYAIWF